MHHPIEGTYHSQFLSVYQAFMDNFARYGEIGASLCIWYRGKKVVDLWGGFHLSALSSYPLD